MREILFRGKRLDNGEWIFGNLVIQETDNSEVNFISNNETVVDVFIQPFKKEWCAQYGLFGRMEWKAVAPQLKVNTATICQYTGLKDKNGERIFEGDIVHMKGGCISGFGVVEFRNGSFGIVDAKRKRFYFWDDHSVYRVDGNIHDNPELLKGE